MEPLCGQSVERILYKRALEGAVAKFTPHDLRRSCISDLLDAGADLVAVQAIAGHSSPSTMARYDRRGERIKRQAATEDEANAASEKFIAMLQGRQYNIDVQGNEPNIAAQHIEDLGDILDLQVRRIDRLSLPRAKSMPCPPQVEPARGVIGWKDAWVHMTQPPGQGSLPARRRPGRQHRVRD